jgi:hypothetical protein
MLLPEAPVTDGSVHGFLLIVAAAIQANAAASIHWGAKPSASVVSTGIET